MAAEARKDAEFDYVRQSERDLFRDRDLYESGWRPSEKFLSSLPVIEDWAPVEHVVSSVNPEPALSLTGTCFGHSFFDDNHYVDTSAVVFWDGETFARTHTDWWRLGKRKRPCIHDMTETRVRPSISDWVYGWPL
jgi:hypothetical protein